MLWPRRACVFQGQLLNVWQDLSQSEQSLNQQLAEFYDTLLSTWHSQLQWSGQVPDPNLPTHTQTHTHTHSDYKYTLPHTHYYCTDTHTHNYINTHYYTRTPTNNYTLTHTITHPHSYTHTQYTDTHTHTYTHVVTAGCPASLPRCSGTRTRW